MRSILAATLVASLAFHAVPTVAGAAAPQTRDTQAATTPERALELLRDGNRRFASGTTVRRDLLEQARQTAGGQYPYAAVLGCIDSRVPPELVFDTGLGDIFAARIAGNGADDELIGSLEFAARVAGVRAIVVLGHSHCGAVKGACDGVQLGHLTKTLAMIAPAVRESKVAPGPHDSKNAAFVEQVTRTHARLTAKALLERSTILAGLAKEGKLAVAPAVYDLESGRVEFLD